MNTKLRTTIFIFLSGMILHSCKKDDAIGNPFDDPALKAPVKVSTEPNLDPNSFSYLYKNVFYPTCANSGCHDGHFEPDFRTMYSAYYTLVNHPVTLTSGMPTFANRVQPGDATKSMLWKRLTQVPYGLIGQGRMPWNEPTWWDKPQNAAYIQNVVNWINDGAKDMFGEPPILGNPNPKAFGFRVFPAGDTINKYGNINNTVQVPANTTIDMWVAVTDDSPANSMVATTIKVLKSQDPFADFTNATEYNLVYSTPFSGTEYYGNATTYTHKLASFSTAGYPVGTLLCVRAFLRDQDHSVAYEFPNNYIDPEIIRYFTIQII